MNPKLFIKSNCIFLSNKGIVLGILIFVFGIAIMDTKAQTCPNPFPRFPNMGVNAKLEFIDLNFNARAQWGTYDKPYDSEAPLDADGWPTGDAGNYFVEGAPVEPGVYNLEFECNNPQGVTVDRDVTPFTISDRTENGNIVRMKLTIPTNTTSQEFVIKFGNTQGGIRKVRLLLPGYNMDTEDIIDPRYIALMAPFSTFRFHDANAASNNPDKEWSQRVLPGQSGQGGSRPNGSAYEYMIELCNKANKDMWLNVPVQANDDYMRSLAKLIKERLAPNLIIHLELGNEIWNSDFYGIGRMVDGVRQDNASGTPDQKTIFGGQFGIPAETGNATAPNGGGFDAWPAVQYRIARRLKEMVEIFGEVYGANEINKKIRGMLCGQIGWASEGHGFNIGPGLEYINAYYGDPSKYFYAVGVAPYYGGALTNSMSANDIINSADADVDCRFNRVPAPGCADSWGNGNQLEGMIGVSRRYGLKLYAYEGAPDFDIIYDKNNRRNPINPQGSEPANSQARVALKDPRMKDIAIKFWKNWFSWCGPDALFNYYAGGISKDFAWPYAIAEDITNSTNAPSFAGVKQVLNEPAPALNGGRQITTVPAITTFKAIETAGYAAAQIGKPGLEFNRAGTGYRWVFSINQNGKYALSMNYSGMGTADIYVNNKKISSFSFPRAENKKFSIPIDVDLYYGVHSLAIDFTGPVRGQGEFVNLYDIRFEYKNIKYPPAAPDGITAVQTNICTQAKDQKYSVKTIDPSACYYKWVLPSTATFTGDNTPDIVVDWKSTPVGTYVIRLAAGNDDGWSDTTRQEIKITNCGIEVSNLRPCVGEAITFTDLTLNATSWNWDFGRQSSPATSSIKVPPAVSYSPLDGTRFIKLTVKEGGQDKTYSKLITVVYCNSPTVKSVIYCLNQGAVPLSATGTNGGNNFKWYTAASGGASIPTPTPTTNQVGVTTYYVSQENGGVESTRAKLDVTVNPAPIAPSIGVLSPYCVRSIATTAEVTSKVTLSPGGVAKWYTSSTATASVPTPTAPNTATANNQSWYVSQSIGACESPKSVELKVEVKEGPTFTVEPKDPLTCGLKGKLILKGLTPATIYKVSYGTPIITADSASTAAGEIVLNVPQGTYNNIKVVFAGCSSVVASALNKITEPASPVYTVSAVQPLECGAQGALAFAGGLKPNTNYQISYNAVAPQPYATQADGTLSIALPKGNYTNIKVTLGECTTTKSNVLEIQEKELLPPAVPIRAFSYCQGQVINNEDITGRIEKNPAYQLRWYSLENGIPSNQPEAINRTVAATSKRWVTQANAAGCESKKTELTITVAPSTALIVAPEPPSACGQADGKLVIKGLAGLTSYVIDYKLEGSTRPSKTLSSTPAGELYIIDLRSGSYSSITVIPASGSSCLTNSTSEVKIVEPLAPTLKPEINGGGTYCATTSIAALTTTVQSGGTIEWYSDASLTNRLLPDGISYAPPTVTGTATFYAVESVGGCKSPAGKASITIVSNPAIQEIVGTGGSASCNEVGYPFTLKKSEIDVNYQLYKDGLAVGNPTSGNASITLANVSTKGTYTFKATSALNNCEAAVTGSLIITDPVNPQQFTVSGEATGCEGTAANAEIKLSGSEENVTYTLTPSDKPVVGTGNAFTYAVEAKKINNGDYGVSATNNLNGCTTEMLGKATINIQSGASTPVLTADAAYCNQGESQIKIVVTDADSQLWTISPTTAGTVDAAGKVSWLETYTGPVTIKVEVSNRACATEVKSATAETQTTAKPVLSFILGDSLVCRGTEAIYQALPKAAGIRYDWQTTGGSISILENDQANGTVMLKYNEDPSKEGTVITVTPISENCGAGMPVTKQVNKDPSCDLYVPNILTIKDKESTNAWHIEGVENYPKLSIQIFNRWGAEVHTHQGKYEKPWDGSTSSGQPLPTATYYYVIDKQDGSKTITGSVTLVRD